VSSHNVGSEIPLRFFKGFLVAFQCICAHLVAWIAISLQTAPAQTQNGSAIKSDAQSADNTVQVTEFPDVDILTTRLKNNAGILKAFEVEVDAFDREVNERISQNGTKAQGEEAVLNALDQLNQQEIMGYAIDYYDRVMRDPSYGLGPGGQATVAGNFAVRRAMQEQNSQQVRQFLQQRADLLIQIAKAKRLARGYGGSSAAKKLQEFPRTNGVYLVEGFNKSQNSITRERTFIAFAGNRAYCILSTMNFENAQQGKPFTIKQPIEAGSGEQIEKETTLEEIPTKIQQMIRENSGSHFYSGEFKHVTTASGAKTIEFTIDYPEALYDTSFSIQYLAWVSREYKDALAVRQTWIVDGRVTKTFPFDYMFLPVSTIKASNANEISLNSSVDTPEPDATASVRQKNEASMPSVSAPQQTQRKPETVSSNSIQTTEPEPFDRAHYQKSIQRGQKLFERDDLIGARRAYSEAIDLDERFAGTLARDGFPYANRGICEFWLKNYEQAIHDLNVGIERNPREPLLFSTRADAKRNLQRYSEALADYKKAIELGSSEARDYLHRGLMLAKIQRLEEAILDYDKALQLKPDYAHAFHNRGVAKQKLGRIKEGNLDINEAIRLGLSKK
jgi:Tfp pilus assembly protein PilF